MATMRPGADGSEVEKVQAVAALNLAPGGLRYAPIRCKAGPGSNSGDDLFGDGFRSPALELGVAANGFEIGAAELIALTINGHLMGCRPITLGIETPGDIKGG